MEQTTKKILIHASLWLFSILLYGLPIYKHKLIYILHRGIWEIEVLGKIWTETNRKRKWKCDFICAHFPANLNMRPSNLKIIFCQVSDSWQIAANIVKIEVYISWVRILPYNWHFLTAFYISRHIKYLQAIQKAKKMKQNKSRASRLSLRRADAEDDFWIVQQN